MQPVTHELIRHQRFREQLLEEFPDIDEETLQDLLEGLTDLREMIAALIRSLLKDRSLGEALATRIAVMQDRLRRLQAREEGKRVLTASVMCEADIRRIVEPDFTVSLRPGRPPLTITDEGQIPEGYWRPQPAKLDRQAIREALQQQTQVPGAILGNATMNISVRTK